MSVSTSYEVEIWNCQTQTSLCKCKVLDTDRQCAILNVSIHNWDRTKYF